MIGNFEAKALDTDAIAISWDADALRKGGVRSIRLVAHPANKSMPSIEYVVNASVGEATVSGNVMPSTSYSIHVEDAEKPGFKYSMAEVRTKPPGELRGTWSLFV